MRRRMLDILACPRCGGPLELSVSALEKITGLGDGLPGCRDRCGYLSRDLLSDAARKEAHAHCRSCYGEGVKEGLLSCPEGHAYPVRGGVPRFATASAGKDRTKKTFDVEWKVFHYKERIYGHTEEEELADFFRRMVVDEDFVRGKTVLDAGCGIGRLARSLSPLAKEVVAVDLSEGVEEARARNSASATVHVLQGDLMTPPLKSCVFDYVYTKGVLHYVPDPRGCVVRLAELVRPGGSLSMTLYPRMSPLFESFNRGLRKITVGLPVPLVFLMSFPLVPLMSLSWKWSGIRERPIEWRERAHMIFNWLSAEHQNRASNEEVRGWFEGCGFTRMRFSPVPVGVTGTKRGPKEGPRGPNRH